MANTTVTDALFMGNVTMSAVENVKKSQTEGLSFANVMDNTAAAGNSSTKDVAKTSTTVEKATRNPALAKEDNSQQNIKDNTETKDAVADKTAEKINSINEEIKKNLDVTDEEIAEAMQALGLIPQDLLNTDSLKSLMMELSQVEDSMDLLTNEGLYKAMESVLQTAETAVSDIKTEFALTDEDFSELLKDGQVTQKLTENLDESLKQVVSTVVNHSETEETSETGNFKTRVNVEVIKDDTIRTSDPSAGTDTFKRVDNTQKSENNDQQSNAGMNTQTVTVTTNELGEVVETIERFTESFNDQSSIVTQVTESIKMNITADSTSMEMLLHPASLGTVNMQITAQNGVITAQLLVQDEAVKAALEGQLIQLQETFEEQGHHVEAVEVSVANYDLNRNSGRNDESNEERENALRMGRTARRRLRLDEISEEELENLDEDEKVNADMMRRQGNTLDYMA